MADNKPDVQNLTGSFFQNSTLNAETGDVSTTAQHIKIVVVQGHESAETGEGTEFKMKPSTKFGKMMQAYCSNKGLDQRQLRFHYDGSRIQGTDTPTTIGLLAAEDEVHVIEVFTDQAGGENL